MFKPKQKDLDLIMAVKRYAEDHGFNIQWTDDMFCIGGTVPEFLEVGTEEWMKKVGETAFYPAYRIIVANDNGASVCDLALSFCTNGVEFWDRVEKGEAVEINNISEAIGRVYEAIGKYYGRMCSGLEEMIVTKNMLVEAGIDPDIVNAATFTAGDIK